MGELPNYWNMHLVQLRSSLDIDGSRQLGLQGFAHLDPGRKYHR
jgi:hypothetical protein